MSETRFGEPKDSQDQAILRLGIESRWLAPGAAGGRPRSARPGSKRLHRTQAPSGLSSGTASTSLDVEAARTVSSGRAWSLARRGRGPQVQASNGLGHLDGI